MIKSGVYQIMNKQNYHMYIGSTVDFKRRWRDHKRLLRKGKHGNIYLQRAWDKYGSEAFEFSVIEYIDDLTTLEKREQWFTDLWNPEYSICKKCVGSPLGCTWHLSEETKRKTSKPRTKEHIFNAISARKGYRHTEETKRKMSEVAKGRPKSEETKRKMSVAKQGRVPWNKGAHLSEEYKQKISKTLTGIKLSEEHIKNSANAHRGLKYQRRNGNARI